jgi:aldehyde:ferredoxin oxidoreductase
MSKEKLYGYNGKILYIDLSKSKIGMEDLEPEVAQNYVGGVGLSAKLTYDLLSNDDFEQLKLNPLLPINPLIFATGPLTGTSTPSSGRYSITGISPLTNIWGESTSGGFFPVSLRRSGYDAIVITGESKDPVYIAINGEKIDIKDANILWNKNTRQTIQLVKQNLNDDRFRVVCIGKAGENLVKYAAIINDEGRAAGRCGLGAIMGKKKLKAITIKAENAIEYFDKNAIIETSKVAHKMISTAFSPQFYSHYGTLSGMDISLVYGDVPGYYFTGSEFPVENLTGLALKEQYPVLSYACAGCTIGCGRTTIAQIDGEEVEVDGPEYETTAAFGPLCGVFDFKPIIKANHLCNLEAIDTISCGVCISFLIYLVENKLALEKISNLLTDIKLEELRWGNEAIIFKLINKIIKREDIGNLLANGTKIMAKKLNVDPELAAHVKGLEHPLHDSRSFLGQALSYMTSCVGANHCKGDFYLIDWGFTNYSKIKKGDRFNINKRESSIINMQDITNIYDSAVICSVPKLNENLLSKLLQASTGFSSLGSVKKLYLAAERATNLKRVISCKLGCCREDDHLTKINSKPLENGCTAGIDANLQENLKNYYKIRGWDWNTGWPTQEKLKELNIEIK